MPVYPLDPPNYLFYVEGRGFPWLYLSLYAEKWELKFDLSFWGLKFLRENREDWPKSLFLRIGPFSIERRGPLPQKQVPEDWDEDEN